MMATRLERMMTTRNRHSSVVDLVNQSEWVKYAGTWMQSWGGQTMKSESQPTNFEGYIKTIHRNIGVIGAAVEARALVLSDVHFRFEDINTGDLSPTPPEILEDVADVIRKIEFHESYGGAGFMWPDRLEKRFVDVRPDEIEILASSRQRPLNPLQALDCKIEGFLHNPNGLPIEQFTLGDVISPRELVYWAPRPDPLSRFRGESWVTSVLIEALIDMKSNAYVDEFYANAATPNMILALDKEVEPDRVRAFRKLFREEYEGLDKAHRTMVMGGGVSATVVGAHLSELMSREIQGGFESRVAVASRVPSSVLGTREGNQGSALNATAFNMMRRLWMGGWFHPQVRSLCRAIEKVINVPAGKRLSWDPQLTLLMQEDAKDAAEITSMQVAAAASAVQGGWEYDAAVKTAMTGNLRHMLGKHTGLVSVQLLPPGEGNPEEDSAPESPPEPEDETPEENDED